MAWLLTVANDRRVVLNEPRDDKTTRLVKSIRQYHLSLSLSLSLSLLRRPTHVPRELFRSLFLCTSEQVAAVLTSTGRIAAAT